ncbi:flavin reductase (DIM6/NTAB) family NADH-FMN oxidoreductase RutF [Streptohalobacillus salinus]|uniref:Flavin reductase (DIM6/NTAB) family NADH-FMN oxidoreductase RutF n=1 Tax=Streptohalobacillus salinus TaxID=621096 RepID=A0A2V3WQN6_9BACI|nr:flavin reductase family protein [Streptohalobacillus salinus]PXW91009.1 flavin reductase (DIM6/NTAB) family NADH-FMN oxidoreductase RutF [Streptohalobacillus salinus]
MVQIDPAHLTEREQYKLLTGTVVPRPIAFVTSLNGDVLNGAPFSYFNVVSSDPPLVSLAVQRKDKQMKDTARNIAENGAFVIHLVDEANVEKINQTAKPLPCTESEITFAGLTRVRSTHVDVDGIREAKIRMECVTHQIITIDETVDLIIGRIIQYHVEDQYLNQTDYSLTGLQPVSRLAGSTYMKSGATFSLTRPK